MLPWEPGGRRRQEPDFKDKVVENQGTFNVGGKLLIDGGLSYHEYNESQFGELEMTGGDIKVDNNGKMTVSRTITGTVMDLVVGDDSTLEVGMVALSKPIKDFKIEKSGKFRIKKTSEVKVDGRFTCPGSLSSLAVLTFRFQSTPEDPLGRVIAKDSLRVTCDHADKTLLVRQLDSNAIPPGSEYLELAPGGDIPKKKFRDNKSLVRVVVADGCRKIGRNAFENCCNLEEAVLPPSIEEIEKFAFASCLKLTRSWPAYIKKVGDYALVNVPTVSSIPEGLEETGSTFAFNSQIETAPSTLRKLGGVAFNKCPNLKTWRPASQVCIGYKALYKCPNLVVTFKKQLFNASTTEPGALFGCKAVWVEDENTGARTLYHSPDKHSPLEPVEE